MLIFVKVLKVIGLIVMEFVKNAMMMSILLKVSVLKLFGKKYQECKNGAIITVLLEIGKIVSLIAKLIAQVQLHLNIGAQIQTGQTLQELKIGANGTVKFFFLPLFFNLIKQ